MKAPNSSAKNRRNAISRRAFLNTTALTAAFTIVPRHVLGGQEHIPPSEKITLAGIGVGGQGLQNIATFLQFPEIQVVAVCDVNRESDDYLSWNWSSGKEKRFAGREPARRAVDEYYAKENAAGGYQGCNAYSDYRELLEREDIDAVMVGTPDHTHAVVTMARWASTSTARSRSPTPSTRPGKSRRRRAAPASPRNWVIRGRLLPSPV